MPGAECLKAEFEFRNNRRQVEIHQKSPKIGQAALKIDVGEQSPHLTVPRRTAIPARLATHET